MQVILDKVSALWHIRLCELVSLEENVDDALGGRGCRCSHVHVRAAVALAASAELHSLAGTEATAARAQQAADNRPMVLHQAGSAMPAVTMHAGTYII